MHTTTFSPISLLLTTFHFLPTLSLPLTSTEVASSSPIDGSQLPVPSSSHYEWMASYVSEFAIHSSCNSTERHELTEGLRQAVQMAEHAKDHILVHGNNSAIYRKYFGAEGATGTPIGWLEKIASGNRAGIIFRCDDPDRNCETQDGWAGHWRGSNATSETVICPFSYESRLPLTAMCARGFTIAAGRPANYWGPDLMHRLYHVPVIGEGIVEHYADGYEGVQELAAGSNYTWAGSNSATLTYFATEVWAYDVAVPGEGCVGTPVESSSSSPSATATATATETETTVTTVNPVSAVTSAAASGACEAHEDHWHCPPGVAEPTAPPA